MRVIDMCERQHTVQRCLNRRAWLTWLEDSVLVIGHQLFVAHRFALEQRQHVVHAQTRELSRPNRGQVRAGALHPKDLCRTVAEVLLSGFARRIATAPVGNRPIRAEQIRAVRQQLERTQAGGTLRAPAVVWGLNWELAHCHPAATPPTRSSSRRASLPLSR